MRSLLWLPPLFVAASVSLLAEAAAEQPDQSATFSAGQCWVNAPIKPRPLHEQVRSEEHTSELQSRENLVCRLLLEYCRVVLAVHSFPTRRSSDLIDVTQDNQYALPSLAAPVVCCRIRVSAGRGCR